MKTVDITNSAFRKAVEAIDLGHTAELAHLIAKNPDLVRDRLQTGGEGYFNDPYLLWFVAGNPIRIDRLPDNILEVTGLLVQAVKQYAPDTYQQQIDYTLGLVASGSVPRESGVQIAMIDRLTDAGASPSVAMNALTNGNLGAARHLVHRGDKLNLALAVCLELIDDIDRLIPQVSANEKLTAIAAAAYYGKADSVKYLLEAGTDQNGYPADDSGFHTHATPLHQAVSSGSIACVKLLVEAGARLDATDKIYNGTALEWAVYLRTGGSHDESAKENFAIIETYLQQSEKLY